jgi:hypothetical protein
MFFNRLFETSWLGAAALAILLIAPLAARAQDSDPVVARANGIDIRQSDLTMAEEDIGGAMPQMAPDQKREYLITYLADVIILAQAADQRQLANRNDVKHKIEFERQKSMTPAKRPRPTTRCTRSMTKPSSRPQVTRRKCTRVIFWWPPKARLRISWPN